MGWVDSFHQHVGAYFFYVFFELFKYLFELRVKEIVTAALLLLLQNISARMLYSFCGHFVS